MYQSISLSACILALLPIAPVACAQALTLKGRIVNEDGAPIGGAAIHINPGIRDAVADPGGIFSIELPAPGDYFLTVQREGFYQLRDHPVHVEASQEITLTLNTVREVFQSVDVSGSPSQTAVDQTSLEQRLNGTDINNIPYPASQSLRNAMRLMPGVVQDQAGGLHFEGASENQVLYTLNGFDVGDPVTGAFNTRLGVEGVSSLEHSTGRFSPEYGKGSAGVLAIQPDTGTDAFHYTATNFIPGVNTNQGLHFGGWTPRFGFSGPLWKGRAWFADNFDAEYDIQFINGLPKNQDSRTGWGGSNLFHTQFNITPTNILFSDFLVNLSFQSHFGLGALSPVSTTTDQRAREYFYSFKDQIYLGHGALFEIGFAQNRFFNRVIPQGSELYVISPSGTSGNYFVDSTTTSTRDQFLVDGFLPAFSFFGSHQVKIGADADRLTYNANFRRTGYEEIGLAGYALSLTTFQGSGVYERPSLELSSYMLDTWRLRRNLQIEMGVRQDWDELVRQIAISPRFSIAYAPWGSQNTKLSAGYAITYDPTNLSVFSRPLDQTALTTLLNPDGTPAGPPVPEVFTINNVHLKLPRSQNWSASLDQRLPRRIEGTLNYLRRRGDDGFTYLNSPLNPDIYTLTNARRDSYDAVQLIVHETLAEQFEWMASYTRSHAESNAVLDLSVDQPLQVANNLGPMPWDAPNRFLGWAYLPLPRKNYSIAVLADARTGYPFSVQDQYGNIVGAVDSHRYPFNFDLNIFVERRFTLRGYRLGLRAGFDNITNSRNPTAVYNVAGSTQYLTFLGNEGRHAEVRIRFFGRTAK
jgi:hypothetical protein